MIPCAELGGRSTCRVIIKQPFINSAYQSNRRYHDCGHCPQEREAVGRPMRVGMVGAGATGRVVIQEIPASQLPLGENA